jgi:hypothetical protein
MRKLMMLNVMALFLCSVISLGCGASSERPISQSDIPDLIPEKSVKMVFSIPSDKRIDL